MAYYVFFNRETQKRFEAADMLHAKVAAKEAGFKSIGAFAANDMTAEQIDAKVVELRSKNIAYCQSKNKGTGHAKRTEPCDFVGWNRKDYEIVTALNSTEAKQRFKEMGYKAIGVFCADGWEPIEIAATVIDKRAKDIEYYSKRNKGTRTMGLEHWLQENYAEILQEFMDYKANTPDESEE